MRKNLSDLTPAGRFSDPAKRVNVYQVWDADGTVAAKLTYDEIKADPEYSKPRYQFSLLHETAR